MGRWLQIWGQFRFRLRKSRLIRTFGVDKYGEPLFIPDASVQATPTATPAR